MEHPGEFEGMINRSFLFCGASSGIFGILGLCFFHEDTLQIVILNIKSSAFVSAVKLLLCVDLLFTYPIVLRPSVEIVESSLGLPTGAESSAHDCSRNLVRAAMGCVAAAAAAFVPQFAVLSGLAG